jgi:hypothetical protein
VSDEKSETGHDRGDEDTGHAVVTALAEAGRHVDFGKFSVQVVDSAVIPHLVTWPVLRPIPRIA